MKVKWMLNVRAIAVGCALALLTGCLLIGGGSEGDVCYVDEFDLSGSTCGFGKNTLALKSVDAHPLTMSGKVYARGFGTHPKRRF